MQLSTARVAFFPSPGPRPHRDIRRFVIQEPIRAGHILHAIAAHAYLSKKYANFNGSAGALVTGLAPSATTLAAYFCFTDLVLISQCMYYNTINARRAARLRAQSTDSVASEDEPLLRRRRTSSAGLPGSQRRASARSEESGLGDSLAHLVTGEDETPDNHRWLHNTLSLAAVYIVGIVGWFVSYKAGAWNGSGEPVAPTAASSSATIVGMSLGYISALCYLCARIPQIIKNYREKSCEGLALLFFLLSLTGNLTYGASVFAYSQETDYIVKAIPWLLGSFGTMVEDGIIFYQFRIYDPSRQSKANLAIDDNESA
ncbi:PQ loop repeat-domain-containing protein [Truncatella angustata]|uniref:PQ loop repeat-domain-containing protein n=1 Tax=Truncatella angustata TaxID=152316 RepID=A0A9P8RIZ8_9PEZI|nr:PQ loop repeat-domain-containing protein [Truncatella angustata]KAH6646914.1 PQ loop repeat-domain-containing protein [Truncatella angustata]